MNCVNCGKPLRSDNSSGYCPASACRNAKLRARGNHAPGLHCLGCCGPITRQGLAKAATFTCGNCRVLAVKVSRMLRALECNVRPDEKAA
jgi:hypothetical protein